MIVFHLTTRSEWDAAVAASAYRVSTRGRSLDDEGFIHCSFAHQVDGVARAFYADVPDLVLLTIDTARVPAVVRVEPAVPDGDDRFPHVYGPIGIDAVVEVTPYVLPDATGTR